MPDLMPDTSIYRQNQPMDLGSLLGMAQRARELQTQSAISDATRDNPDDPVAATRAASQRGAFVGPREQAEATHAAQVQADLQKTYAGNFSQAVSAMIGRPGKLSKEDAIGIALQGERTGLLPKGYSTQWVTKLPDNDKDVRTFIADMDNYARGNANLPVVSTKAPSGETYDIPGAAVKHPGVGGGGVAGPVPGSYRTGLATGQEGNLATSAGTAAKLQDRAPMISAQRGLLSQMRSELDAANTGGPALSAFRMHVNQTLSGLGLPGIDPEEKQTATQLFNKFSYQLQQQQANGWTSEKNLASVFSANPSIALTKLGNSGVLAFLQGNNDTENLVLSQWNKWKAAHGGGPELDNLHRDWLNDTLPTGYGRGFNAREGEAVGNGGVRNFDPRVLQFQNLPDDEKTQFYNSLSDKEKQTFARNLNRYKKFNYLEEAQQ